MPKSPEIQPLRLALPVALVTMLIGVLLWIVGLFTLPSARPPAVAAPVADRAPTMPVQSAGTAEPLPTIAANRTVVQTPGVPVLTLVLTMTPQLISAAQGSGAATTASTADGALAARLADHLICLVPHARHDAGLDARAVELAMQDASPLPATGMIQIAEPYGRRILLGVDALANVPAADGRCGETLIFGVPPLEWLTGGARFGLGVGMHTGGAVVVVVTE